MCLLTPRQASSRHSSSKLGFALGSLCHSHESTSPTFHHLLMILSSLCIVDADGSESRLYAKHIASDRGAMRRCVLGKRNDVGASEMRPHLPPTPMSRQGGKAAPCRIFLCGDVLLQIVARLRHAVLCQDRWLFCCGVRIRAKDFSPLQEMPNNHQYPPFLSGRQV